MSEADAENVLIDYYRRYVGDPDRTIDVYAGFGLFSAGIALGVIGVVVFLYSATLDPTALSTFAVREVAAVAGAVGLPALLFGIVVLLPVDRRMLYLAGAGIAITLASTGAFTWAYPHNWNVVVNTDYSAQIVAVYTLGLVAVIGATGGALVAHRVERATGGAAAGAAGAGSGAADAGDGSGGEAVTEESVRADIERELDDAELTWGGVERSETRRLELNTSAVDEADVDTEKLAGSATETRTTSGTVNDAVSELKGLQGGEAKTDSGQGTDDQAAKLRELREQQRKEAEESDEDGSVVDRIKGLFG
ncbi:putative permease [Halorubrum californiense DSM 19288]|uniref:Putative permease n=1 Tax=Halorubrum californiense DSM 19288 TaxID=1227465 RepID=M0DZS2_9EURY|nr:MULTISPECIES: permease [Halorubrum]ELZ40313.1 putative permease [Halorubrum californiense DSM 19288]TKX65240.1 permease [Halorubrum sp. GN11GM_10-3_MGM]